MRSLLHQLGYRFRLHSRHLSGCPDIYFTAKRKAIFVHGCFWHQHDGCRFATRPKSSVEYWTEKLARNHQRDAQVIEALKGEGIRVLVVWECETVKSQALHKRLHRFLGPPLSRLS